MKRIWTKEQIQKEIQGMDEWVPVSKIEERLGMPPTTLQKVISGKRELPNKWVKILEKYFIGKPEVKLTDQTKPNVEIKPPKQPKTNYTVNTAGMSDIQRRIEEAKQQFLNNKK